uniref:Pancreatic trypsin inhibitor n=1 Tax=Rhipicephalus zambeziensis TaxID=60191 RepID=A0A224YBD8_9ACAR
MHNWVLLALLCATLSVAFATRRYTVKEPKIEIDCIKNATHGTCRYPEACTSCPRPVPSGHTRLRLYYFNNQTRTCEEATGNGEDCNGFEDECDCWFLCVTEVPDYCDDETQERRK